ncbi:MAG: hypothetical protein RIR37_1212 [Verrucomicrobiota bacterium]
MPTPPTLETPHGATTTSVSSQYDAIGNRTFAEKGAPQIPTTPGLNTTGYTANALNQYNAITAYNTSGVAGTPIAPVFDADGNMEQGPLPVSPGTNCTLVWDAENRLIEVKSASNVTLVKYAYDALSRRISRNVSASPNSYTLYLYDGWNCIAEWNANSQSATLTTTRTWGLDLSSTPQGAGGVGGLLSEKQGNNTFYPTYDGNGNISEYLAADGSTAAHYEYDPFGNIVKESYASAYDTSSFSYKFSTKPLDQATGLYYYGYRYYDPKNGRWPSRDPIEEEGGVNLYGFVGNNGVNRVDYLGLWGPNPPIDNGWGPGVEPFDDYESNYDRARREQEERERPCCDGKKYFAATQCCVEGKILNREKVDTGVSKRTNVGFHRYLEYPGGRVGCANTMEYGPWGLLGGRQIWNNPDDPWNDPSDTNEPIKLSPCDYDINEFVECIRNQPAGDSGWRGGLVSINCITGRNALVSECLKKAKR